MKKRTADDFIDLKSLRDEWIDRIDVLERVSTLALMPGNEVAILKQVADYYKVPEQAIKSLIFDHKDELVSDGYQIMRASELISSLKEPLSIERPRGRILIDNIPLAYSANGVFTKRAILRVGMLLRDSEVAKQVRTYLLDVEQITQEVAPGVIHIATGIMDDERVLKADLAEAILNGDIILVTELMSKIKHFDKDISSKRIAELSVENTALLADNKNLMAQFETCELEKENALIKIKYLCDRTRNLPERRALCTSIIEAYGEKEFNSEKKGYDSVYATLNTDFNIDIYSKRPANSNKAYISFLNIAEITLLEILLRKLVITYDLKDFYLD